MSPEDDRSVNNADVEPAVAKMGETSVAYEGVMHVYWHVHACMSVCSHQPVCL